MLSEKEVSLWRDAFEKFGACEVPSNIFSKQFQDYIKITSRSVVNHFTIKEKSNPQFVVKGVEKDLSKSMYNTFLGESMLQFLTPLYSKIVQKNLVPTYSFFRRYNKTNSLSPHRDRPSCQYSVTIQIDASENTIWPIVFNTLNNKIISTKGGLFSPVFYQGEKVLHWRDPLEYDYSTHLFLHYVDNDDEYYSKFAFDGRSSLYENMSKKSLEKLDKLHTEMVGSPE